MENRRNNTIARRFLPALTTINLGDHSWEDKLRELATLRLSEIALFVTGLSAKERHYLYAELEKIQTFSDLRIPFVHAVSSMPESEYWYLVSTFKVERFNLHPLWNYPLEHALSDEIRKRIYIENLPGQTPVTMNDLTGFAGFCCDLSHLYENCAANELHYRRMQKLVAAKSVGANHISAVPRTGNKKESIHLAKHVTDFDYLREVDPAFFSDICAIELANSLTEQINLIDYIENCTRHSELIDSIHLAA